MASRAATAKKPGAAAPAKAGAAPAKRAILARARAVCLGFPEATEKEAWQTPTFRVRTKMYAMFVDDHHGDGMVALWCKAPHGFQEAMVENDPERFFVPPYVGPSGWVGVRLDVPSVDWEEVAAILEDGYRMVAPDRLVALLDGAEPPPEAKPKRKRRG
jgi:hypothetical protein